jgi:hypothetical protein
MIGVVLDFSLVKDKFYPSAPLISWNNQGHHNEVREDVLRVESQERLQRLRRNAKEHQYARRVAKAGTETINNKTGLARA